MPASRTTYGPRFRTLWFDDDDLVPGGTWPRGKMLKYKLEALLDGELKSYGSNRRNEIPCFRTFICASHRECQFKVKAIRISGPEAKAGAALRLSLAEHSPELYRNCGVLQMKSTHPTQIARLGDALYSTADAAPDSKLGGHQRLAQAVRNKRKQFLANNHQVATSFDEALLEV
ncbi:hypothetical protein Pmar_PMAR027817 [Perkinsus marinus ATCC 50983]|uniref:Uncharacterized protein n=1 Tax=Perkinsus marinus (strain ATCC 50983 / TXsc) TaxID=423536 RepID=C5KPG0_PERM5|nr:hypothetical protein Pmar_PMAR027817 [Perkinsus marinus ATCC 50983]EER13632.1 hypothetical protein Pmar_PMAR027817 [Perkinsus marinus ATCC 50983]|eukprot:XP_002781837.1 hypothetical protein Pmar_PMAR027817 [Perkinsus marinus ATCC 50983]